jgi:hypothetical protein
MLHLIIHLLFKIPTKLHVIFYVSLEINQIIIKYMIINSNFFTEMNNQI